MSRPKILVLGSGFAGTECAHKLEKKLSIDDAEIRLVTPVNYQLYLPLLPQVASGVLTPQSVAVSLRRIAASAPGSSPAARSAWTPRPRSCVVRKINGEVVDERYDYLVLAPGSVTRHVRHPRASTSTRSA